MSLLLLLPGGQPVAGGVTGTATWEQAAASWSAVGTESFEASGAFLQAPAAWEAVGAESLNATATFSQAAAAWEAAGLQIQPVTGTGTWVQTASWAAVGFTPAIEPPVGRTVKPTKRRVFTRDAIFEQAPPSWAAVVSVTNPIPEDIEELMLVGVL